ncbi:hypothetical protein A3J43_00615 [Candidatus Uhrbacteria bacterium RIFCSPHIGHO2_12_FULL_54_23]|uniref:Ribonuclease VapC n=1 Tax=Candidatus Uhrbacteria bacterium RIFCSPHIGHO2_12_FULL_54_23 TaxID=1802397 RepID=A0A1F7UJJ4_9BACT|nr:MAG: hypothetical protein A3J43_00615 [Candidatus Uhrbacteria bacterium RIFCSPHIGHO2_12_FULL_54_23]
MPSLLLDTSVLIDHVRRRDKASSPLLALVRQGHSLHASIVTHTELYSGKSVWERESAREELAALFSHIEIIPLDLPISIGAGKLAAAYSMATLDAIIAATALARAYPLATLNRRDFLSVRGLKLMDE